VLPPLLPGSVLVGEEGVSRGDHSIDRLGDKEAKTWIVDPVDGTYNFVHGKREFGVMVGLVINGVTEYGWIYDVLGDEMIAAEKGSGAYAGSQRLQVKTVGSQAEIKGFVNPRFFPNRYKKHVEEVASDFATCLDLRCAAHSYMRLAKGEAQFSLYCRFKPWDHIPGALITDEAGAHSTLWNGEPYKPGITDKGLITGADQDTRNLIYDRFIRGEMEDLLESTNPPDLLPSPN